MVAVESTNEICSMLRDEEKGRGLAAYQIILCPVNCKVDFVLISELKYCCPKVSLSFLQYPER